MNLNRSLKARMRRTLLNWYHGAKRDLPWRTTDDPYCILVAEYMSQQTQLDRVRHYYDRFLKQFPNIQALARASSQRVLKAWEGMGYYHRARHLHAAAKKIVRELGGRIPNSYEGLLMLPGCGPYTAAAIASIAFNQPVAVLDGNVTRVICRFFAIADDPRQPTTRARLRQVTSELIPPGQARDFNQALMELGALVCTPQAPRCDRCCWNFGCQARQLGLQTALPVKSPSRPLPHHQIAVGVVWKDGHVLIAQRDNHGLLGGLWEFPGGKCQPRETLQQCCAREVREEVGVSVRVGRKLMTINHAYSHFRITMHVFACRYRSGTPKPLACQQVRWVLPHQLRQYPFPAANKRLIEYLWSAP
ncbi:MAG: A/G-specific adenine glycosylase [Acidobacteriota bacterium]|nr:A/G-specific adenine glycosylase [Blastocatellia bacterium]MDW8239962.1 A/G-specific adenine glycosylase [Acidobacteriota bacterium]